MASRNDKAIMNMCYILTYLVCYDHIIPVRKLVEGKAQDRFSKGDARLDNILMPWVCTSQEVVVVMSIIVVSEVP